MEATNTDEQEFQALYEQFKEYINSDKSTWSESDKSDTHVLWRRILKHKTTLCLRLEAQFPGISPKDLFELLTTPELRTVWDSRITTSEVIEKTETCIKYYNTLMKVSVPFFVQRDQTIKQYNKANFPVEGTYVSVANQLEHPDYPEGYNKLVRTDAKIIGY